MNILPELYLTFARMGAVTFGGGYAMLPMLQREVVEKKHWATEEEMMDYYAISQCTPGVISVNAATFIGRKQAGIPGGILATLGVITPSLIIITILAAVLSNFADIPTVQHAFAGIRVAVFVLILDAVVKLAKKAVTDLFTGMLFAAVFLCAVFFDISPVIYVVGAAVLAAVFKTITGRAKK